MSSVLLDKRKCCVLLDKRMCSVFLDKRIRIMESPVDFLPNEVLQIVFSNLNLPERLNASLVCKKWLEAINCQLLLKDIIVVINDNRTVPIFEHMSRNFLNFSFRDIMVDNKYYKLFKRFSAHIQYLSFEKCSISSREEMKFDELINLKVLNIIDCSLWYLLLSVPNLSELCLRGEYSITDKALAMLQTTMKYLKVFRFFLYVSYQISYCNKTTYEATYRAVLSFISERASTLKELYFYCVKASLLLKDISCIKNLHLHKFGVKSSKYADGLIDLFKNQPDLKVVHVKGLSSITDDILNELCCLLPNVEEVVLNYCSVTDAKLSKLFQLNKLIKLHIDCDEPIFASAFNIAISNFKAVHLKSLKISLIETGTSFMDFDVLFTKCKYLEYLDLSDLDISDSVIHIISENLVHLEYLNLKHCCMTDYGLTGCKTEFQLCFDDPDEKDHAPLSNLKNLKELILSECYEITDIAAIKTIQFQYLEILSIVRCNFKLETVKILVLQNPSIKMIDWDIDIKHTVIGRKKIKTRFY